MLLMHSKFWHGVMFGTLVVTALATLMGPVARPARKPLVERGAEAIKCTAGDFAQKARRVRRRMMRQF